MKFLAVWFLIVTSCLMVWAGAIYWLFTSAGCSAATPC